MSVSLTIRRPWILAVWAVLTVVAITSPHPAWLSLLVALTSLIGVAWWWAREMATRVTVERSRRFGWAQVGDLWCFRREHSGLAALWPAGAALANAVIFAGVDLMPLLIYLTATVLLVIQGQFLAAAEAWERQGVDYSPEIRLDMTLVSLALAGGIVAAACSSCARATATTSPRPWWSWHGRRGCRPGWRPATPPATTMPGKISTW